MTIRTTVAALACAAVLGGSALAAQADTFATFLVSEPGNTFSFTNSGPGSTFQTLDPVTNNTAVAIPVVFQYNVPNTYSGVPNVNINGTLVVTAQVSAPIASFGGFLFQEMDTVTMTFLADTPVNGDNVLLKVVRSAGTIYGRNGGTTASFTGDTNAGYSVNFESDFLGFTTTTQRAFALSFTNASPSLASFAGYLRSFTAAGNGTFDAENIPEPASLGLLGLGALALIRRRK